MTPFSPSAHDTVTSAPSGIVDVPVPVPTTAGRPSSRLTIAAWAVRPPRSVTIAAARFMMGSQSGSVISVTSTSPSCSRSRSETERITRTVPFPIFSPTASPLARTSPRSSSTWRSSSMRLLRRACTVSGRAWTRNSSPVFPSFAHSMSMGVSLPCSAE